MVAVVEGDIRVPIAVGHAFHGMGVWVPSIEITDHTDTGCLFHAADETDGFVHVLGRIAVSTSFGVTCF